MICAADNMAIDASVEHLLKLTRKMATVSSLIAASLEQGVAPGKQGVWQND
jgi:hypothetical protein